MFLLSLPQCGLLKMTERYDRYVEGYEVAKKFNNPMFMASIQRELKLMEAAGEKSEPKDPPNDEKPA